MISATSTPRTPRLRRAVAVLAVVAAALTAAPAAHAQVPKRDLPTRAQIVAAMPVAAGIETTVSNAYGILRPARKCGTSRGRQVGTGRGITGSFDTAFSVTVTVYDVGSAPRAALRFREYRTSLRRCRTYPDSLNEGATVTQQPFRVRRLGQAALAYVTTTTFASGDQSHSVRVMVLSGDRIATIGAFDSVALPRRQVVRLAKVAARKMR